MLIVAIAGGLGNQMFQYALYLKLKNMGKNVKIDLTYFNDMSGYTNFNGYELERLFAISPNIAEIQECYLLGKPKKGWFKRIKQNIGNRLRDYPVLFDIAWSIVTYVNEIKHRLQKLPDQIQEANANNNIYDISFLPEIYEYNNKYLNHGWQSEKYFLDIETEVRTAFAFKIGLDKRNTSIANSMKKENSIAIHVRRGDYLLKENLRCQNVCNEEYYFRAIKYIKKMVENPVYYVFSNDIEWCRENLQLENANYIDWNTGLDSYKDMQLMSMCKHNVIANSTFSWWGAWLNKNPNKIVVMPNKWFDIKYSENADIYPETWIRM